jgi:hypothetical protein
VNVKNSTLEVVASPTQRATWFKELKKRRQERTERLTQEELIGVASELADRGLKLPKKLFYHFTARDLYAYASDRTIGIGESSLRYLNIQHAGIFRGILAHELSHISDDRTRNNCNRQSGVFAACVAEGKAEMVALQIAGDDYSNELMDEEPPHTELDEIFNFFVTEGFDAADVSVATERLRLAVDLRYSVGRCLVGRVVVATGVQSVFDIHDQPVEFFRENLDSL